MSEQVENSTSNQKSENNSVCLSGIRGGVLGVKAGMSQIYNSEGDVVPVTVIDLQDTIVTQIKTQAKEGYNAVQVGFLPKKAQRVTNADKGHFKKSGNPGFYHVQEFRVDTVDGIKEGTLVSPNFVKEGELVDITGTSKGKGFQGGMKRYNMSGGFKTHGASLSHRSLGSIGNRADPAKCFKNKKMPGHMGAERKTIQNLKVLKIDAENKVMLIKGSIPGRNNDVIMIRKAIKGN